MDIDIDMTQIERYQADLQLFARRAVPFAARQTLNDAAWQTRAVAQSRLEQDLTLRNKWTLQSVRVEQARGLNVNRMESVVGSTAPYMARQEFGGVAVGEGKSKAIATTTASGEGENATERKKLPTRGNKMRNIALRRRKGKTKKQRNLIAVRTAMKKGASKHVYLDMGRTKGIFLVKGGRPRMVWDMSRRSVVVPARPWLAPSVAIVEQRLPEIGARAAVYQLRRHGILGY